MIFTLVLQFSLEDTSCHCQVHHRYLQPSCASIKSNFTSKSSYVYLTSLPRFFLVIPLKFPGLGEDHFHESLIQSKHLKCLVKLLQCYNLKLCPFHLLLQFQINTFDPSISQVIDSNFQR